MTQSLPSLSTLLVGEANLKPGTALLLETAIRELVRDEVYAILNDDEDDAEQRDDELVARIVEGIRNEMGVGTPLVSILIEPVLKRVVSEAGEKTQREVAERMREMEERILTEVRART